MTWRNHKTYVCVRNPARLQLLYEHKDVYLLLLHYYYYYYCTASEWQKRADG